MEKLAEILKEKLSKYTPEELEALFDKYDQFDGPTIDDNINDPCEPKPVMKNIVEIDFKQLLEDISYTNKVTKKYDVSDIISRNQYYELKDALVLWMVKSDIISTNIDGMEYTVGKNGDTIPLLKMTISYNGFICQIHQKFNKRLKKLFNNKVNKDSSEIYVYHGSEVPYNEEEFVSAINRMYAVRIKFLRATLGRDAFWKTYSDNKITQGDVSWMVRYIDYLPNNGEGWFKIVEKPLN